MKRLKFDINGKQANFNIPEKWEDLAGSGKISVYDNSTSEKGGDYIQIQHQSFTANLYDRELDFIAGPETMKIRNGIINYTNGMNTSANWSLFGDYDANTANRLINSLSTGSAAPVDNDYYVSQNAGGGTTTTTYHRRPMSALWSYIKSKFVGEFNLGWKTKLGAAANISCTSGNTYTIRSVNLTAPATKSATYVCMGNGLVVGDLSFSQGNAIRGRSDSTARSTFCFSVVEVPAGGTVTQSLQITSRGSFSITTDSNFWGMTIVRVA